MQASRLMSWQQHPWHSKKPRSYRPAPPPMVPRIARSYEPIAKIPLERTSYPANIDSVAPTLDDLSLCQGLFANETNFSSKTACDIFDLHEDGTGTWDCGVSDEKIVGYIESFSKGQTVKLRDIFCTLRRQAGTSFGFQQLLTRSTLKSLLTTWRVSPHFLPLTLGEPDYWAPLDIHNKTNGMGQFICQYPRYNIHVRQQTCSVYMGYDPDEARTTYIVASGEQERYVERTKSRLRDYFTSSAASPSLATAQIEDPFLLQSILCHESMVDGKDIITDLRYRLYDQLDIVGEYAKEPFDRSDLREMTNTLHKTSQDADSLFASTQMRTMIAQAVFRARQRTLRLSSGAFASSNVGDALVYIVESLRAQQRWLQLPIQEGHRHEPRLQLGDSAR
ncbi:hypothetical protein VTN77DRAFT_983 [Rasamsonia byssochlamydoides]|uniref:uncharacterized protein n=1 Tax=Rasamsonia byssochlamydoides TaxID=89139 RepID=UPI00374257A9